MNVKINWFLYPLLSPLIMHQIHYLILRMDNITLWFYRYLSGGIFLLFFVVMFKKRETVKIFSSKRTLLGIILYSLMLIVSSFASSQGVLLTNATTGNLFSVLVLPLTMGLAYIIWKEDSALFKDCFFHAGIVIVFVGIIGFLLSNNSEFTCGDNFVMGCLILLGGIILTCISTLLIRRLLLNNDPLAVTGIGMSVACVILFIPVCLKGGLNVISVLPTETVWILFFSGAFGAAVGFLQRFLILKKSGIAVCNLLGLTIPVTSGLMGVCFLGETFNFSQISWGIVLLSGCYLCIKRRESINKNVNLVCK